MSRSRGVRSLTMRSPIRISPSVISSRPASIRSAVVFPQPDGPTSTISSPSLISSSRSWTACVPSSYTLETWSYAISATAMWSLLRVDQAPVVVQQRVRVGALRLDVALFGVDRDQPRLAGGEAAGRRRIPLHRVAEPVAARTVVRRVVTRAVGEADLVALIDERRSGQRQEQVGSGADILLSHPRGEPVEVVVSEHPGDALQRFRRLDRGSQRLRAPRREQELEREDEVEVLEPARILGGPEEHLANEQRVASGLAQRPDRLDRLGAVRRVDVLELAELAGQGQREVAGRRRVVAQLRVLDDSREGVDPEAVHAASEPEAHDILHRGDDLGVPPIQVRLLRVERVQVPAAAYVVTAPGRAAEHRAPVVRRPVDRRPDVPVRVLPEPRMLDRGVRDRKSTRLNS